MHLHAKTRNMALVALVVLMAALAVSPAAALAARGDGPYTPFPDRPNGDRSESFVNKLNQRGSSVSGPRSLSPKQLAEGVSTAKAGGARRSGRAKARHGGRAARGKAEARVGRSATAYRLAGFTPVSPPPEPSPVPLLVVGALLGLVAVAVGVYRVRRRWAA